MKLERVDVLREEHRGAGPAGEMRMGDVLELLPSLIEEYAGKVTIANCDVEECEDIAVDLGIRSVPTIMFFKEGKLVDKIVGAANKAKIQEKIESML